MKVQSKELEEYIHTTLSAIANGVKKSGSFKIKKSVKLSIVVTNVKTAGGGLKVYVAEALGKYKEKELSRIELTVDPLIDEKKPTKND